MNSTKLITALFIALALTACGKKEESQTASQPSAVTPPPAEVAKSGETAKPEAMAANDEHHEKGEHVFKGTCAMCHQTGAGGAPIKGNKADWEPRIAQGKDVLYKHALEGFKGGKGAMPAKGANASLSDDDVKAAVDYMVSEVH